MADETNSPGPTPVATPPASPAPAAAKPPAARRRPQRGPAAAKPAAAAARRGLRSKPPSLPSRQRHDRRSCRLLILPARRLPRRRRAALPPGPRRRLGPRARHRGASTARASDDSSPLLTRRAWMGLAWGAFTAASAAALAATGRFMFPNVLNEPPQQFKAGLPSEYGAGVDERWKEKFGVWIVRTDSDLVARASGFYALLVTCTHLGCTPNYLPAEAKFKCPCHGSGFRTGSISRGPHSNHGYQFRGARTTAARTRAYRACRRRPVADRQVAPFSIRARTVDRSRSVSESVARALGSGIPAVRSLRHQMEDGRG